MSAINGYITPTASEAAQRKIISIASDIEQAFADKCCFFIVCAYFRAIEEKKIKLNWSEPTITRHLKKHLKSCLRDSEESIHVDVEYPDDRLEIDDGEIDSRTEVYFDLMLTTFASTDEVYFGVEAKILIEQNFLKRNARTELMEYISEKGMRKFIEGIYRKRGCMVAYVMQGNIHQIIQKLNAFIQSDSKFTSTEIITGKHTINYYEECYISAHLTSQTPSLKHLMLSFS